MSDDFYEPLYKGATAPSMVFGVPMIPLVLVSMVCAQLALVTFFMAGIYAVVMISLVYIMVITEARRISRTDDQRLMQWMLRLRMRVMQRRSIAVWGAVTFTPIPHSKK